MAQRQRKIKKFIRKIGNHPNNTLSNTSETNDKLKRSNNENTQDEIITNDSSQSSQSTDAIKPSKRRIIVPIRRTRLNSSPAPVLTTTAKPSNDLNEPAHAKQQTTQSNDQKKKLFVKRRRITPKPLHALEPSITQTEASLSSSSILIPSLAHSDDSIEEIAVPEISLEIATRLATTQRTFTYVVTRVHDKQSEIISSTIVRDQIKTLTDTITHTIHATTMHIQPTKTLKFARTSIA